MRHFTGTATGTRGRSLTLQAAFKSVSFTLPSNVSMVAGRTYTIGFNPPKKICYIRDETTQAMIWPHKAERLAA